MHVGIHEHALVCSPDCHGAPASRTEADVRRSPQMKLASARRVPAATWLRDRHGPSAHRRFVSLSLSFFLSPVDLSRYILGASLFLALLRTLHGIHRRHFGACSDIVRFHLHFGPWPRYIAGFVGFPSLPFPFWTCNCILQLYSKLRKALWDAPLRRTREK